MDEDCDVDVESAEEVPDIGGEATASTYDEGFHDSEDGGVKNDKREHHNLLERRRRDHIKESFYGLRDCIPQLKGEKVSRAHILNKATEYIRNMQKGGSNIESDIVGLKLRNEILEQQIKALERHKAAGSPQNAEEILEAVQEEITAKHKEEQQKQTKKINSLVSERNDGDGRPLGGVKTRASSNAVKKTQPSVTPPPAKTTAAPTTSDPATPLSSAGPAISLLASNLKNTQTLLTALQKSLPPNTNLPANIKTLAQRVLNNPIARSQLQATASSSLRGIVTATTVTSKPTPSQSNPETQQKAPPDSETAPSTLAPTILAKPTVKSSTTKPVQVKVEPLNDTGATKPQQSTTPPPKTQPEMPKTTTLVSALTTPTPVTSQAQTQQPSLSPQQILRTAHLLLQQQGSALNTNVASPEKQNMSALTPEVLAQVSSYLNLPGTFSTEAGNVQAEIMPIGEEGMNVSNSFLTAALTSTVDVPSEEEVAQQIIAEAQGIEGHPHTVKPVKRAATCSEDEVEQTVKKPRVVL